MKDLAKHIEVLLLENDCVIVPELGGFVAHYVSAKYDERDGLFLPPMRTIGFNPQLTINDSLLAQSYAKVYRISMTEAAERIEKTVQCIKNQADMRFPTSDFFQSTPMERWSLRPMMRESSPLAYTLWTASE